MEGRALSGIITRYVKLVLDWGHGWILFQGPLFCICFGWYCYRMRCWVQSTTLSAQVTACELQGQPMEL
jgi:hypothetical protein